MVLFAVEAPLAIVAMKLGKSLDMFFDFKISCSTKVIIIVENILKIIEIAIAAPELLTIKVISV